MYICGQPIFNQRVVLKDSVEIVGCPYAKKHCDPLIIFKIYIRVKYELKHVSALGGVSVIKRNRVVNATGIAV